MKIEWSEDFKKRCAKADKSYGWEEGEALERASNILDHAYYEEDLDELDQTGSISFEFSDWLIDAGPFTGHIDRFDVDKDNILNWHEYYMYRKTVFKLEKTA